MSTKPNSTTGDDDWLRQWTVPEEERAMYTREPWRGELRWFRSPNVICIETWRRLRGNRTVT
jgi:hypothetical protein